MNKVLGGLAVAVFGFAMTSSAATVLITDEFGTPITDGTLMVTPWNQASLSTMAPSPIAAVELRSGGYSVPGVNGHAIVTFEHTAYGELHSKADFSADIVELVINEGGFLAPLGAAPAPSKGAAAVAKAACPAADTIAWADIVADPMGVTVNGTTSGNNFGVNCGINGSENFERLTVDSGAPPDQKLNFTTCTAPTLVIDHVLQIRDSACAGNFGCNDDDCSGHYVFNSTVNNVAVTAGSTYTVQIDRWATSLPGEYNLNVQEPFELDPPEGGCIDENEPNCGLVAPPGCASDDFTNGGCNFDPPLFIDLACGDTICATYGNCGFTRDTDWYQFVEDSIKVSTWECIGEGSGIYGFVNTAGGPNSGQCPATAFLSFQIVAPGVTASVSQLTYPGTWTTFGATSNFGGQPCGLDYQCTLSCECPAPCGGAASSSSAAADGFAAPNDGRLR